MKSRTRVSKPGKEVVTVKKDIRLYNVLFPIWVLMFWPTPPVILITLFGNLAIDCGVLYVTLRVLKHPQKKEVMKGLWPKFWGYGFLADIIGAVWLWVTLCFFDILNLSFHLNFSIILLNPWRDPLSFLWTLSGVAVAGVCIYLFDKRAMKNCDLLDQRQIRIIALTMAIVTAPWLFLVPLYW